jgi:signal transduction histidine kinase/DNA-binding response OmpR family regulator
MRLLGRGDEARVRWRGRHQSGHWVWLESSPALLRDGADEAVNGFIDVIRDITERKEREDALAAARLAAEEAVRSKSDFVANVSHELRTPLNSIIGFSRLLTEGAGLNEEAQRRVRLIHSAGQALQSVIDNVLDFSKLEAAALELNCAPFDLRAFIPETIALLEPQAAARDLPLRALVAPDVPAWVVGDEGRLRQVLLNLLSNAVKFTREGHVEVRLRPVPIESGEARLRVEVRDTGSGISQQRLDTLFSRFVQAAPSVAAHYGGTGLGLAITRQLVDLMGGEIGVESRVGAGSTFWFEVVLPIAAASAPAQDERSPGESWRGKHILVVDDVDLNRDLMLATLSSYGCAVEAANDGAQAVAAVLARPFDLVLMDCQMPVMDGFAATEAIRAAGPPHNATPIVALTASAQSAHIERCRESGMDDHLSKPLNEKLLEQILARYLSARPAHSDEEPGMPVTTEKPSLEERYRARKLSTLEKINAMIRAGRFGDDERAEIAALSHQLAGTAALFGDPALGEEARALEIGLERWSAEERPAAVRASYEKLRLAA